jgi:hypothetical protein
MVSRYVMEKEENAKHKNVSQLKEGLVKLGLLLLISLWSAGMA